MSQLTTSTGSASQSTTQSPQTAGSASTGAANASSVQPGTATDLLNNPTSGTMGIPLSGSALTTVNLSSAASSHATTATIAKPVQRHINPALFGISIAFFVLAVALFWFTSRTAKNTTE